MTGPSSLAFPGSRKLAGWWRQLAPFRPQALWVGHLALHEVEALVRVAQSSPLDPFTLLVLKGLALADFDAPPALQSGDEAVHRLNDSLHLGRQVVRRVLEGLQAEGLVESAPHGTWLVSPLGRQALETRHIPHPRLMRRTFHFVDHQSGTGAGDRLWPHFLALHNSSGIPWPPADGLTFDVRVLEACLRQPPEWKQKHGFPLDVQEILGLSAEGGKGAVGTGGTDPGIPAAGPLAVPPWQAVILDRPEWVLAVILVAAGPNGIPQLVGLPVRQDGWVLQAASPLFTLAGDWQEVFPELGEEPTPEAWRQAWRTWCEQRTLSAAEADACGLERRGERLRVAAPPSMVERLRAMRSDVLKGETWLLAGEGQIRAAVLVELTETEYAF
jgi:hypothetical protein